jgi:hypothetical protein
VATPAARRAARDVVIARLLATLMLAAVASGALAQEPPDVPAGQGRIAGVLSHPEDPRRVADIEVVLYALAAGGEPGLRRTRSDAAGRFAFEGVSASPGHVYLVGTRIDDIPFGARVVFDDGSLEQTVEIGVSNASGDPADVEPGVARVRITRGCTDLRFWHGHALRNDSDAVVHIPEEARAERPPLFAVRLPEGARGFETPLGGEGIEFEGGVARFWGPLYPGDQEIEFGYGIEAGGDTLPLRFEFATGAERVELRVPADDLTPTSAGLEALGEIADDGPPERGYGSGAVAPGHAFDVVLDAGRAPTRTSLETPHSRIWLELDDAMLEVNEVHRLNGGDAIAAQSAPLLCVPIPPEAHALRFSPEAIDWGLTRDPSGALALHGPLPAGDSAFALRYGLPVGDGPVHFERRFESRVPLLEMLVADTGIRPQTERLHPRRPMRTEDRNYLHLEAFEIEPGERVQLTLERLPAPSGLSSTATAGVVAGLALATFLVLAAPLNRADDEPDEELDDPKTAAREAVYRAIDDLDEDLETGKLAAEDHARMRAELRAQAVALLSEQSRPAAPEPAALADSCPACHAAVRPDDRFCAQCGHALRATDET